MCPFSVTHEIPPYTTGTQCDNLGWWSENRDYVKGARTYKPTFKAVMAAASALFLFQLVRCRYIQLKKLPASLFGAASAGIVWKGLDWIPLKGGRTVTGYLADKDQQLMHALDVAHDEAADGIIMRNDEWPADLGAFGATDWQQQLNGYLKQMNRRWLDNPWSKMTEMAEQFPERSRPNLAAYKAESVAHAYVELMKQVRRCAIDLPTQAAALPDEAYSKQLYKLCLLEVWLTGEKQFPDDPAAELVTALADFDYECWQVHWDPNRPIMQDWNRGGWAIEWVEGYENEVRLVARRAYGEQLRQYLVDASTEQDPIILEESDWQGLVIEERDIQGQKLAALLQEGATNWLEEPGQQLLALDLEDDAHIKQLYTVLMKQFRCCLDCMKAKDELSGALYGLIMVEAWLKGVEQRPDNIEQTLADVVANIDPDCVDYAFKAVEAERSPSWGWFSRKFLSKYKTGERCKAFDQQLKEHLEIADQELLSQTADLENFDSDSSDALSCAFQQGVTAWLDQPGWVVNCRLECNEQVKTAYLLLMQQLKKKARLPSTATDEEQGKAIYGVMLLERWLQGGAEMPANVEQAFGDAIEALDVDCLKDVFNSIRMEVQGLSQDQTLDWSKCSQEIISRYGRYERCARLSEQLLDHLQAIDPEIALQPVDWAHFDTSEAVAGLFKQAITDWQAKPGRKVNRDLEGNEQVKAAYVLLMRQCREFVTLPSAASKEEWLQKLYSVVLLEGWLEGRIEMPEDVEQAFQEAVTAFDSDCMDFGMKQTTEKPASWKKWSTECLSNYQFFVEHRDRNAQLNDQLKTASQASVEVGEGSIILESSHWEAVNIFAEDLFSKTVKLLKIGYEQWLKEPSEQIFVKGNRTIEPGKAVNEELTNVYIQLMKQFRDCVVAIGKHNSAATEFNEELRQQLYGLFWLQSLLIPQKDLPNDIEQEQIQLEGQLNHDCWQIAWNKCLSSAAIDASGWNTFTDEIFFEYRKAIAAARQQLLLDHLRASAAVVLQESDWERLFNTCVEDTWQHTLLTRLQEGSERWIHEPCKRIYMVDLEIDPEQYSREQLKEAYVLFMDQLRTFATSVSVQNGEQPDAALQKELHKLLVLGAWLIGEKRMPDDLTQGLEEVGNAFNQEYGDGTWKMVMVDHPFMAENWENFHISMLLRYEEQASAAN